MVVALTAALTAVFAASALWLAPLDPPWDPVLLLANTLPLLAVRRQPLVVTISAAVCYPLWLEHPAALGPPNEGHFLQSLPLLTALFFLGSWRRPLWLRALGLVTPLWMVAAVVAGYWEVDATEIAYVAVVCVAAWALGVAYGSRSRYAEELETTAAELRAAQSALAERAVADERARVARELHDVIAHAMSVITVQAGVGAHLVAAQPERAGAALSVIERTGREALAELRRMLTVLRDPAVATGPAPAPQPGLRDLPSLVTAAGDAGIVVTSTISGVPRDLPPGLDLAAYRVVQEALTNVVKHAPGVRASVSVAYAPTTVAVTVADSGAPDPAFRPGQGLRGMAERVALYDSTLSTVAATDGFRVTATFPVEAP